METIEIKCPCCSQKLKIFINEIGDFMLQSFDLYNTETLTPIKVSDFGLEFGQKGGNIDG